VRLGTLWRSMLRPYKGLLNLGGNLGEFGIGDGIFVFAPGFEAAFEGANAFDALFSEEKRHTGAGGFVWSSAIEDDFAIAR
jgi:hypothetical protein